MSQTPRTTTVRLTPPERRLVDLAAQGRGIGPSTYIRRAAIEAAERDVLAAAIADPGGPEPECQ
jgi:uncharacterized protein (DUF1778 family)